MYPLIAAEIGRLKEENKKGGEMFKAGRSMLVETIDQLKATVAEREATIAQLSAALKVHYTRLSTPYIHCGRGPAAVAIWVGLTRRPLPVPRPVCMLFPLCPLPPTPRPDRSPMWTR